jgi:hypothetical protein
MATAGRQVTMHCYPLVDGRASEFNPPARLTTYLSGDYRTHTDRRSPNHASNINSLQNHKLVRQTGLV